MNFISRNVQDKFHEDVRKKSWKYTNYDAAWVERDFFRFIEETFDDIAENERDAACPMIFYDVPDRLAKWPGATTVMVAVEDLESDGTPLLELLER